MFIYEKTIQVLRKADMIRKNAVESILAERDILISVQNPFVVSSTYQSSLVMIIIGLNINKCLIRFVFSTLSPPGRTYILSWST